MYLITQATSNRSNDLGKLISEKEGVDKQVADVASQVNEINAKLEEKQQQLAKGSGKNRKSKGKTKKKQPPAALKEPILEAAGRKDLEELRESFAEQKASGGRGDGSGCCLVL